MAVTASLVGRPRAVMAAAARGVRALIPALARPLPRVGVFAADAATARERRASSSSSAGAMGDLAKATRLNHVAIAVPSLADAAATYKNLLGAKVSEVQVRGRPRAASASPRARRPAEPRC